MGFTVWEFDKRTGKLVEIETLAYEGTAKFFMKSCYLEDPEVEYKMFDSVLTKQQVLTQWIQAKST